jgi:hypothetical protein
MILSQKERHHQVIQVLAVAEDRPPLAAFNLKAKLLVQCENLFSVRRLCCAYG